MASAARCRLDTCACSSRAARRTASRRRSATRCSTPGFAVRHANDRLGMDRRRPGAPAGRCGSLRPGLLGRVPEATCQHPRACGRLITLAHDSLMTRCTSSDAQGIGRTLLGRRLIEGRSSYRSRRRALCLRSSRFTPSCRDVALRDLADGGAASYSAMRCSICSSDPATAPDPASRTREAARRSTRSTSAARPTTIPVVSEWVSRPWSASAGRTRPVRRSAG